MGVGELYVVERQCREELDSCLSRCLERSRRRDSRDCRGNGKAVDQAVQRIVGVRREDGQAIDPARV